MMLAGVILLSFGLVMTIHLVIKAQGDCQYWECPQTPCTTNSQCGGCACEKSATDVWGVCVPTA